MSTEVVAPDGTIVEFPDGMSQNQIRNVMRNKFGGPEPAPTPEPKPDAVQQPQGPIEGANPLAQREPNRGAARPEQAGYAPMETSGGLERSLQIGAQSAGSGLANLAGLPVDLTTAALNAGAYGLDRIINLPPGEQGRTVGRITDPVGGGRNISETAGKLFEAAGGDLIGQSEMTPAERVVYKAGEIGTEAITGGAGLARRAATRASPTPTPSAPVSRTESVAETMTEPYRQNPGRAFTTETAAGTTAGAAVGTNREFGPEATQGPIGDVAAGLLGGYGGAVTANKGQTLRDGVMSLDKYMADRGLGPDPETGIPTTNKVADKAARFVQGQASDPEAAAARLRTEREARAAEGAPDGTSGIQSGDTGLIGVEQQFRINNRTPFTERDQRVRGAAADEVQGTRPQNADPNRPRQVAERYRGEQLAESQRVKDAATGDEMQARNRSEMADAERRQIGEELPYDPAARPGASETLDETVVDNTMRPRRDEKNRRFREIDPEGEVQRSAEPFVQTVQEIRTRYEEIPSDLRSGIVPERLLNDIEGWAAKTQTEETGLVDASGNPITRETETGGTRSFRSLNEMRPALSDAEKRARQNGYNLLADNLRKIRSQIGEEAQRVADEGGSAGQRAQGALDYYQTEFAPYFARGQGGKLREDINKDDGSRSNTPPTGTAERFLRPGRAGGKEAAQDLREILKIAPDRQTGERAAREYFLADLTKTLNPDGSVNPRKLRAYRDKRSDVFSAFPQWEQEVNNLLKRATGAEKKATDLSRELDQAVAERKRAYRDADQFERDLNKQSVALLFDTAPRKTMDKVYGADDPGKRMADIVDFVKKKGSERDLKGLQALVSDDLIDRVSTTAKVNEDQQAVGYAKLFNHFKKNEDVLSKVYGPEDMNRLQRARRMLEPFQNLNLQATRGSPTAEYNEMAMNAVEGALKGYYGVLKGGGVMRVLKLLSKSFPDDTPMVAQLVKRSLFDPRVMEHLATRDVKDIQKPAWRSRMLQLLLGAEAGQEVSDTEEGTRIDINQFKREEGGPRAPQQ